MKLHSSGFVEVVGTEAVVEVFIASVFVVGVFVVGVFVVGVFVVGLFVGKHNVVVVLQGSALGVIDAGC